MLEVGALSGFCRGRIAAEGENLGAKLGAGGAEEVCLLHIHNHVLAPKNHNCIDVLQSRETYIFDIGFRDKTFPRYVEVESQ